MKKKLIDLQKALDQGSSFKMTITPLPPEPKSVIPYLHSEYEQQLIRMQKLGINTEAQMFEQSVNELLNIVENIDKSAVYKCFECEMVFGDKLSLNIHRKECHIQLCK